MVSIRRMQESDVGAVVPLFAELGYPVTATDLRDRFARLEEERHGVFVAESDEKVVGWIHVTSRDLLLTAPRAEIMGLVVSSTCRGQGLGKTLIAQAEAWARAKRFSFLRVFSNLERTESHPFYLRLGFVRTKQSAMYERPT